MAQFIRITPEIHLVLPFEVFLRYRLGFYSLSAWNDRIAVRISCLQYFRYSFAMLFMFCDSLPFLHYLNVLRQNYQFFVTLGTVLI